MRATKERAIRLNLDRREMGSIGVCLSEGSVVTIQETPAGSTILCVSGECWLTQEEDFRDYRLGPGDAIALEEERAVVLQALAPSHVRVSRWPPPEIPAGAGSSGPC